MQLTKSDIYSLLAEIPDPEIPVITIDELGILRNVELTGPYFHSGSLSTLEQVLVLTSGH